MFNLLVVGAGQLGARYLQGIVNTKSQLKITVVDPAESSLEKAESDWIEAGGKYCQHQISWGSEIPLDLKYVDLALVVTSARGRAEIVQQISSQMEVQYWVLEKVLAQSVGELEIIRQAIAKSRGAWVNTARRMMAWHKTLKKEFESKGPIKASYFADLWGLTCNSIHYIDLISWWTEETLNSIDTSGLDISWFESKRRGYFEVTGKLAAYLSGGSTVILEAREKAEIQPLRIELTDGTVWRIDEVNGIGVNTNNGHIDGRIELQSQLSERLVDDILLRGQCDLPTVAESSGMHAVFLEAMLIHWNRSEKREDVCVPIT